MYMNIKYIGEQKKKQQITNKFEWIKQKCEITIETMIRVAEANKPNQIQSDPLANPKPK